MIRLFETVRASPAFSRQRVQPVRRNPRISCAATLRIEIAPAPAQRGAPA
jgi:hypothetical protein